MAHERYVNLRRRLKVPLLAVLTFALGAALLAFWLPAYQAEARQVAAVQRACSRGLLAEQEVEIIRATYAPGRLPVAARQQLLVQVEQVLTGAFAGEQLYRESDAFFEKLDQDMFLPSPQVTGMTFTQTHLTGATAVANAQVTDSDGSRWAYTFTLARVEGEWRVTALVGVSQ